MPPVHCAEVRRPMKKLLIAALIALPGAVGAADDAELLRQAQSHFRPIPASLPTIHDNVVTREKIDLGRMLYFDPRLSASQLISCNTCHNLSTGGDDNLETTIGHGATKRPRNVPTVYNAVFNAVSYWDWRAAGTTARVKGPIESGIEMTNPPEAVEETLRSIPAYVERFRTAFPGSEPPVTFAKVVQAIEAFETTLVTPNARFDQFLNGKLDALTPVEKTGLHLFMDKGCATCHQGINLGGHAYYPFGVFEKPNAEVLPMRDRARFEVSKTTAEHLFRASPLRNIALTTPYFHSGRVWDLKQAVSIMATSQFGAKLEPSQIEAIVAFLETLTGEPPRIELPFLPPSTDKTPPPH